MGVRGLQKFLKNKQDALADEMLMSDTSLVIDANNLLCLLHSYCKQNKSSPHYRNDIYGGDFVSYGQTVRLFFKNLDMCNIAPILVFDGSTVGKKDCEDVVSKENTLLRRGCKSFNDTKKVDEFPSHGDETFLPQRLVDVSKSILLELNLEMIYTPYEADAHIPRVANQLKCPVLSNDSDFIIFNLDKGFSLVDLLDWDTPVLDSQGKPAIKCRIFNQKKFEASLAGFRRENLPLMTVLLGNDYVQMGTFDAILRNICPLEGWAHQERIQKLLLFFVGKSLDDNIKRLVALEPNGDKRPLLESTIRKLLRNYDIELDDNLRRELELIYPKNKTSEKASPQHEPAVYLRRLLEQDVLPGSVLDMVFKNTHYAYSILDDTSLPTSSTAMFRLYRLVLVLLRSRSYEGLSEEERKAQIKQDSFCHCDRHGLNFAKFTFEPLEQLESFGSLEHLDCYSMILLAPSIKQNLFNSCFRFNEKQMNMMMETMRPLFREPLIEDASVTFMLIRYIGRETQTSMDASFVNAVLLTYLYYAGWNGYLNKESVDEDAYDKLSSFLRPHTTMNNKRTYSRRPELYRPIIHLISQLHATFRGFTLINTLLGCVYQVVSQDKWFNGVLMFRLTKMLQIGEQTMEELCKDLATVLEVATSIEEQVQFVEE